MEPETKGRRDSSLIWILLGVLLLGGVLVFSGVYILARYLTNQVSLSVRDLRDGGKSVKIETPQGSLSVNGEVTPEQLGLPLYPGARRAKPTGASLSIEVPSTGTVQVAAAEFETGDALEKVAEFYRSKLGSGVGETRQFGRIQFLVRGEGRRKIVALHAAGKGASISLASVLEAENN